MNYPSLFITYAIFSYVFIAISSSMDDNIQNIEVSMGANFASVPLLFEIAEFVHDSKQPSLYFDFIEELFDNTNNFKTDEYIYNWTSMKSKVIANAFGTHEISSLKISLSLHYYTPRLAMFEQLYMNDLPIDHQNQRLQFIQLNNKQNVLILDCNEINSNAIENEIKSAFLSEQNTNDCNWNIFQSFDHFFSVNSPLACSLSNCNNLLIFYADILSPNFNIVYEVIKRLILESNDMPLCGILRPIDLKVDIRKQFNLQGYGVELAIKNLEYKVQDDRTITAIAVDNDAKQSVVKLESNEENNKKYAEELQYYLQSLLDEESAVVNLQVCNSFFTLHLILF